MAERRPRKIKEREARKSAARQEETCAAQWLEKLRSAVHEISGLPDEESENPNGSTRGDKAVANDACGTITRDSARERKV